jgi:tripartite-type tricarboxylate transporter receptor subunit TctC
MADPELRATYAKQGVDILDQDAAATMQRVAKDHARWAELIRQKKIAAE